MKEYPKISLTSSKSVQHLLFFFSCFADFSLFFLSLSTWNFSVTTKLALGVRPSLCLPSRAHCCSVATPCVSYLPLATASCGLETLSFLTSFPFPDSFSHEYWLSFFISEYGGCLGEKLTCSIQIAVPFLAFSLAFHDTVRESPVCFLIHIYELV